MFRLVGQLQRFLRGRHDPVLAFAADGFLGLLAEGRCVLDLHLRLRLGPGHGLVAGPLLEREDRRRRQVR